MNVTPVVIKKPVLSQYPCDESCTYFEEKTDDAGKKYLHCIKANCNLHYSWRMTSALTGCALHSSRQQADREKMDNLWQFCVENSVELREGLIGYRGDDGFLLLKILKKIAELHQQGEQE
jgi:hypothetical protein